VTITGTVDITGPITEADFPVLFDHLVGGRKQRRRNGQTEHFRSLEINGEFELGRLLNGNTTSALFAATGMPVNGRGSVSVFTTSNTSRQAKPKSELYANLLPVLNGGRAELLDHPRLAAQLIGLERRTARGGRDSIDHAPGAHDDIANAVVGVIVTALSNAVRQIPFVVPFIASRPRNIPGQQP
jgi:hypothetical protein